MRALSRELEIGRRIQQGFLPQQLPQIPGWKIAALCQPARQVGGDFYDALIVPSGQLAFVVADVCDKGVGAALYMALFRSLLRVLFKQAPAGEAAPATLERNLALLNDYIAIEHGRDNMFATMFVGILDPESGALSYLNAGHDPPMLRRRLDGSIDRLPPSGPAVGLMPDTRYATARTTLAPGDQLLVYTDGIPEALDKSSERGERKLIELLAAHSDDAGSLLEAAIQCVSAHVGERDCHDDVTLLCLQRG